MWLERTVNSEYARDVSGIEFKFESNNMIELKIGPKIRQGTSMMSKISDKQVERNISISMDLILIDNF